MKLMLCHQPNTFMAEERGEVLVPNDAVVADHRYTDCDDPATRVCLILGILARPKEFTDVVIAPEFGASGDGECIDFIKTDSDCSLQAGRRRRSSVCSPPASRSRSTLRGKYYIGDILILSIEHMNNLISLQHIK